MISTIHDATIVNKGRKDMKKNVEIKKPYAVGQYNKFIKGVDRAGLLNCVLFSVFFCVYDNKYKQSKVQELPAQGREVLDIRSPESN